jgi:hypothetical protein
MKNKNTLTSTEKKEIIEDFKDWSGGFTPDECPDFGYDEPTKQSFIEYGMDDKFREKAEIIEDFLINYPS